MRLHLFLIPTFISIFFPPGNVAGADVQVSELEDRIRVEIDGKLFTEWRHKEWFAPYFYPVVGPNGENITRIKVRHKSSPASIQNITFETGAGTEIEFNGKLTDGTWTEIALEPSEIIVGCYGCCWSEKQPEIVGLGFVTWKPLSYNN